MNLSNFCSCVLVSTLLAVPSMAASPAKVYDAVNDFRKAAQTARTSFNAIPLAKRSRDIFKASDSKPFTVPAANGGGSLARTASSTNVAAHGQGSFARTWTPPKVIIHSRPKIYSPPKVAPSTRPKVAPSTRPKVAPSTRPKVAPVIHSRPKIYSPPKVAPSTRPKVAPSTLHTRGVNPTPGTRVRPEGIPNDWRITSTRNNDGVIYRNPVSRNENVRVMQGKPSSPYLNSQKPYVRQQDKSGSYLKADGSRGLKKSADTHIPLNEYKYKFKNRDDS